MNGLRFLGCELGSRITGTVGPVPNFARLLLAAMALAVPSQAQTTPAGQEPYCPPGATCPRPEDPVRTVTPDTIIDKRAPTRREQPAPGTRPETRDPQPPLEQPSAPLPPEYTEFQQFALSSVGRILPMYGYSLFENVPSTFAPVDQIPVTPDYIIGPGDEILIRGWGQVDIDVRATVDRNGSIFIPKVGDVRVAGLRYAQLREYLKSAVGRVFQNFDLNVTLGELRSIQVFVVGQARRPGSYTVSSLSTLVNALFVSGGPSPAGSLRHIQLKRNNRVVTEFDFYDLLLNGDKSKDAALLPGDVIYVPPVGPLVALAGSVNVPAIYELKGPTALAEVLQLAGGLTTTAAGQKATVERIENRSLRKVEEFPLDGSGLARPLQDGDLVNIISLSPRFENAVTLRGNVAQPGRYPWHQGMRVSDLIPDRETLITREYWLSQNLTPEDAGAQRNRETILQGPTATVPLEPPRSEWIKKPAPSGPTGDALIRTEVKRNAPEINWDYAVIQRLNRNDLSTLLLPFNLRKAVLEHDEASNLLLEPGDVITVFSHADLQVPIAKQSKFVRLEGEFKASGVYQAETGNTLRDVVDRAGGLTENAYLFGSQFTRESTRIEQQKRMEAFLDEMEQQLDRYSSAATLNTRSTEDAVALRERVEGQRRLLQRMRQVKPTGRVVLDMNAKVPSVDDLPSLTLEDGDQLLVPARPATVSVLGAVFNQNAHLYRPGKSIADYLRAAGGTTREADRGRMFVIRADGSVVGRGSSSGLWGAGFNSLRLMPGDTIVVPDRLPKKGFIEGLRDWTQIFTQFALGAAAVKVLRQ